MSKNEFDALLLKKIEEDSFAYNPASWDKLSQLLPPTIADTEFDNAVNQKINEDEFAYQPASWSALAQLLPAAPMAITEFDQAIIAKVDEGELAYNPQQWDKIAAALPPSTAIPFTPVRNKWKIPAGLAAALVLLLGGTLFFKSLNDNKVIDTPQPQITKVEKPVDKEITDTPQPATTATTATEKNKTTNSNSNVATNNTAGSNTSTQAQNNSVIPFFNKEEKQDIAQIIPQKEEQTVNTPPVEIPRSNKELKGEAPFIIAKSKEQNNNDYGLSSKADPYYASAFYEGKPNAKKNAKTSVAVAGGVNYGNVSTGYSAGVSLRRKIAGDFFVDGTVAMLYNNNANDLINYSGPTPQGNRAARPASNVMAVSAPAIEPTQNLYYVQFNPSVGYQIEKHVALSVGGDFQQMMKTEDGIEKMQLLPNSAKVFPTFDVGITAKSEFGITPNIHAGLVYREGLNNLLKSGNNQYVNRRYVQVQFKYSLPVN